MEREEVAGRKARSGWRESFLNRHRNADDATVDPGDDSLGEPRPRSLSRSRAASQPRAAGAEGFDQRAVLDQDRALIEQLTQRPQRERPPVKKPPPPPKVTPYRSPQHADSLLRSGASEATTQSPVARKSDPNLGLGGMLPAHVPGEHARFNSTDDTRAALNAASALNTRQNFEAPSPPESSPGNPKQSEHVPPHTPTFASSNAAQAPSHVVPVLAQPVVPRGGQLFTASDIDNIMNQFGTDATPADTNNSDAKPPLEFPTGEQITQNFGDISDEFFKSHKMDVPVKQAPAVNKPHVANGVSYVSREDRVNSEFQVPDRKALKEQINMIDSWLDDDFSVKPKPPDKTARSRDLDSASQTHVAGASVAAPGMSTTEEPASTNLGEAALLQKLEDVKRRKGLGECVSPVYLKDVAAQAKPLFPSMSLETLIRVLQLFTSARCEDHDLHLRILGEIPVQIRGISPAQLTTCLRVMWRLRLHEETYLELFSMEAMNMIRAGRRPAARGPRRAPNPARKASAAAEDCASAGMAPVPPSTPPQVLGPFSALQLVQIGNALSQLGAKHPTRFLDVFQEQLAVAIPQLTADECEMVHPTFAMSQLMHDPLRRAFLERCMQVDAGKPLGALPSDAVPDIAQHQLLTADLRRRTKNFRNIYVNEAAVRKETFSFFSSLPAEVRAYMDKLHACSARFSHEGQSTLVAQVAGVLDQLGVQCDLTRMAGPLSLHIVAKATNPRAELKEVVYECSDATAFYAVRQDDKGKAPQHTSFAKLRHRFVERLGIQLHHIGIWEWQQLSEAQRVNYMVKLQSLQ